MLRMLNAHFHEVNQVRSTAEILCTAFVLFKGDGVGDSCWTVIAKWPHRNTSFPAVAALYRLDCSHNIWIRSASAKISSHPLANLLCAKKCSRLGRIGECLAWAAH